jgi:hypothetical protein
MRACNTEQSVASSLRLFSSHLADRYEKCGQDFVVLECRNCHRLHTLSISCGLRICGVCTRKRWSKLHKKYAPLVRSRNPRQLSLLTLTIKNLESLDSNVIHTLIENFVNFRRRIYVKRRLLGGLWCIELKGSAGNYNLHLHCIIEHQWFGKPTKQEAKQIEIPPRLNETKGIGSKSDLVNYQGKDAGQLTLSAIWEGLSGDPVIDIRRIRSAKQALKYVLKYVTKPPDLEAPEDFVKFLVAFRAIPMIKLFGSWYHAIILIKPRLVCYQCNSSSWTVVMFSWQLSVFQIAAQPRGP